MVEEEGRGRGKGGGGGGGRRGRREWRREPMKTKAWVYEYSNTIPRIVG